MQDEGLWSELQDRERDGFVQGHAQGVIRLTNGVESMPVAKGFSCLKRCLDNTCCFRSETFDQTPCGKGRHDGTMADARQAETCHCSQGTLMSVLQKCAKSCMANVSDDTCFDTHGNPKSLGETGYQCLGACQVIEPDCKCFESGVSGSGKEKTRSEASKN